MKMNGGEAIVRALEDAGVDVVFGYPGGVALPIFDALYDATSVRTILPRHEQGAVHMADGYARVTGKPAAVIVTSGPGATNTVTGIANAYMDSIPMVVLTAQVATPVIGTDAFQESDITGITLPITKHNYLVKNAADLPETLAEAFHIASTGRQGPVLVDIPADISKAELMYRWPAVVNLPGYKPTIRGHARQIKEAARLISRARRPLLYAGGGVLASGAWKELKELAELMQIPVATTLMGKGAFPEDHHLCLGMPGMHGPKYVNYALTETDLLIAIGVRFDDRVTGKLSAFATKAKVIHADIDPAEIGKNKPVDVPIVGDARSVLTALVAELRKTAAEPRTEAWMRVCDDWRTRFPLHYHHEGDAIMPQFVVERVRELTKDRPTIIATEVGPEPDVGVPVRAHPRAAHLGELRRPGHDGLRAAGGHRRAGRPARSPRRRYRRRRLDPDELAGDGHGRHREAAGQGRHPQQRLPRHGAAVAGALLRAPLRGVRALAGRAPTS